MTTPVLPLLSTSELVAKAWLGTIPSLNPGMVATQLPADETSWAATGFIQATVVSGSPDIYMPVKKPVLQLDFWATNAGSDKAPWGKAAVLGETVRYATLQRTGFNRVLTITAGNLAYPSAVVQSAYFMTEIRRVPGDPGDYAHFSADMSMTWVTVNDRIP